MRWKAWTILLMLICAPALAQIPTGTLAGSVTDASGGLPGVTVTLGSANLQGTRTAVTTSNGDYIFEFLPPGSYEVRVELAGFRVVETSVKISAAQGSRLDLTLEATQFAEEVSVTGAYETISTSNQVASTNTYDLVNKLPVSGSLTSYAALTAGVTSTGPSGNLIISGAMSFENLFLVNGVVVQDNVRNTPLDLYIEDAVQETTTSTAGISAEFGRFSGGVVNMLTRSGGNELHGSFRLGLSNDKWSERAPLQVGELADTVNKTYQLTLGGWFLKDRLWYFAAGRLRKLENGAQTYITNIPYTVTNDQKRYEGKLTFAITPEHRLIGSYIKVDETTLNSSYSNPMDLASLFDPENPQELITGNYTGILTDNFFIEAQYSKKKWGDLNSGCAYTDLINGTMVVDRSQGGINYRYWCATFSAGRGDEWRNNDDYLLKASYFLSTPNLGTHQLAVGYDQFTDIRDVNNYQSGSDFRFLGTGSIIRDGVVYPRWLKGTSSYLQWNPIFDLSKGTDFVTESAFLNDRWRLNNRLSFNVGVRYDKNDGRDSLGKLVAKDDKISPRLGVTWDVTGDGEWLVNASYGTYVMAIANTRANVTSSGGRNAQFQWNYSGPDINRDVNAPTSSLIDTATALQMMWDWFNSLGGTSNTKYRQTPSIPGVNTVILGSLDSPSTDELTAGVTLRLGSKGLVRADYVHREYKDFYTSRLDMSTGSVGTPYGSLNVRVYENDKGLLERTYDGLQMQATHRLSTPLSLGGTWTISRIYGNIIGETENDGPVASSLEEYPEYSDVAWSAPKGELSVSQRHKVRLWASWDIFATKRHHLTGSVMESFYSGSPYGASGAIDTRPYVTNPGYLSVPSSRTYWFTSRDSFKTESITRTDLSFVYSFIIPGFGADIELFLQPVVTNLFNEKGVETVNQAILTNSSDSSLARFDPFTERPEEGVHWRKGADFGKATAPEHYQAPRTFTVSLGVRF